MILPSFFDSEEVAQLQRLDAETPPARGAHSSRGWQPDQVFPRQEYDHYWSEQCKHTTEWVQQRLHPIANECLQENYAWFCVDFHVANPGCNYVHAHIDTPYQFQPWHLITELIGLQFLIAVDDFTIWNGGTRFVAGTHREHFELDTIGSESLNEFLLEHGATFAAPAGSVLIYHPRTLHSTMPNHTAQPRRALLLNAVRSTLIDSLRHYQPACS